MPNNEKFMIVEAGKHVDFLYKGYILSSLEDDLYNVYSAMSTSKELWDALEKKYKTEDACLKKFVVIKFLDCTVVNEAFQAAAMIGKLSPLWRDFKNHLKHKRKEMKLEDLVIRLKIEEDNKIAENESQGNSTIMGANIIKETAPKRKKKKRTSRQTTEQNKKKFKENCCNYGKEWWIDSGATRHVCAVKEAFATYFTTGPEEELYVGNTATTKIKGYGKIFLIDDFRQSVNAQQRSSCSYY
uniref:Uncharacterized protein LOC104248911 n=1 Tax=Nicotiana sylvestris TaxID=4096 RepID=A0A1U7YHI7_NICSY|nr:PREDICTED: uncharacterized protein LOC104248911 [Nicotiana sylvestris]